MKEFKSKLRIKDIAKLAGVSEGTVDRVLHERGEVSKKSQEAVNKVLEEMNYSPNLLARSLASKKQYKFICLFPEYNKEDYWESIDKGFDLATQDFINHNVYIVKKYFNQFDENSFVKLTKEVVMNNADAVFLAPIFREKSIKFTNELIDNNIPFSFIDSNIEDANFLTYYGQDSFKSGFIAAKLLLESLPHSSQVLIIRTKRNGAVSNQTIARHNGFLNYIEINHLSDKFELINVEMVDDDETENRMNIQNIFQNNLNIRAAITFNSKVYRLANHLVALNKTDVRLIGYDLLTKNVNYLKQDVISYLISQRPEKQAYYTVRDMCKELIFKQEVTKINYVPIDILIKENIEDYMNFRE